MPNGPFCPKITYFLAVLGRLRILNWYMGELEVGAP